MGIQSVPKAELFDKVQNRVPFLERKDDVEKIKRDFEEINRGIDELKEISSDSSLHQYNKDSIRVLAIEQLESQQGFLDGLSTKIDNPEVGEVIGNHSGFFDQAKARLAGDFTMDGLAEVLNDSKTNLYSTFRESIAGLADGLPTENLFGNGNVDGKALAAFFEGFDEPMAFVDQPLVGAKEVVSSRINRKVGFEDIGYREVVVQAQTSGNTMEEQPKWKIGLLYNLSDGISYSSLANGYLGLRASPKTSLLLGGSVRLKSNKISGSSSGYGLNVGLRREFPKNWFAQAVYERNNVTHKMPKPHDHLDFEGMVNDGSIGLGKVIYINRFLGSVFTGTWNPFYNQSKSLQGTRFGLRVGIEIGKGKADS